MTYVIGPACIDVTDQSCVEECPVDCIYQGDRKLYIHPDECVDCGACEPVCPMNAIAADYRLSDDQAPHLADAGRFFFDLLPGRTDPIGAPAGAAQVGPIGADTELIRTRDRSPE